MIRYSPTPKGTSVYSEYMGEPKTCEISPCITGVKFIIKGDQFDDDPIYCCEEHLERKDFILSGRCDHCKRHSFDNWLCLIRLLPSKGLFKLCKQCLRKERRKT